MRNPLLRALQQPQGPPPSTNLVIGPAVHSRTTPAILKGATYDGWKGDALTAPSVCWDGTRFLMNVAAWDIARSKWAGVFFTSPDLETWTYMAGSMYPPTGVDYINANGGFAWFLGKYWQAPNHYPQDYSQINHIRILSSTDPTLQAASWVTVVDELTTLGGADPHLVVNPKNGKLECWSAVGSSPSRTLQMHDTPDGLTWTYRGVIFTYDTTTGDQGEAAIFYNGDDGDWTRWMSVDASPNGTRGQRQSWLYSSPNQNTTWIKDPLPYNMITPAHPWESVQVYDAVTIICDTGDGKGRIPRLFYSGGDNSSSTDNTNSSIGIAYGPTPMTGPPLPVAAGPTTGLRVMGTPSPAGSMVRATWDPVLTARDYLKQYRVQGSPTWLTQAALPGDFEEFEFVGLTPSTNYEMQVAPIDENAAVGAFSNTLVVTTPASTGVLFDEHFLIGTSANLGVPNLALRIPDASNAEGHRWVILSEGGAIQLDQGSPSVAKFFQSVGLWHANTARKDFTFRMADSWGAGVSLYVRDTGGQIAGSCEPTDAYGVRVDTTTGVWQIRRYVAGARSVLQSGTITFGPAPSHVFDIVMNASDQAQLMCDGVNVGVPFAITGNSWGCSVRISSADDGEHRVDQIKAF